jgi:hypothetical protein
LIAKSCNQNKELKSYQVENRIDSIEIKRWKDKSNQEHILVKSNEINYANLINSKNVEITKLRSELSKDKTIIGKQIIQSTTNQSIKTIIKDSISYIFEPKSKDTVKTKIQIIKYEDKWLKLSANIKKDSLYLTYLVDNKYNISTKYKSTSIFKSKQIYIELVSENPNTTNKIQVYTIQKEPKSFYETKLFSFLTGAAATLVIQNQLK